MYPSSCPQNGRSTAASHFPFSTFLPYQRLLRVTSACLFPLILFFLCGMFSWVDSYDSVTCLIAHNGHAVGTTTVCLCSCLIYYNIFSTTTVTLGLCLYPYVKEAYHPIPCWGDSHSKVILWIKMLHFHMSWLWLHVLSAITGSKHCHYTKETYHPVHTRKGHCVSIAPIYALLSPGSTQLHDLPSTIGVMQQFLLYSSLVLSVPMWAPIISPKSSLVNQWVYWVL